MTEMQRETKAPPLGRSLPEVVPDPKPLPHEVRGFQRLRLIWWAPIVVGAAGVTVVLLDLHLLLPESWRWTAQGAWLFAFLGAAYCGMYAECPRCTDYCFRWAGLSSPFATTCPRCGIRLFWSRRELQRAEGEDGPARDAGDTP